jgi:glucokinase
MSEQSFTEPFFIGVDVGGTNIKIGVVDDKGAIVCDTKFPTKPDQSPEVGFDQAKNELTALLKSVGLNWHNVAAVGLGTPGPMDINAGRILTPVNLPGWHNFPVKEKLSEVLGKPITYANDANAAAFGEYWVGGGQAFKSMILITLGTGVGGGIIVDNLSVDGEHSHGSEIGHMTIDTTENARLCGCGIRGHLEAYASATALVDRAQEALAGPLGAKSALRKMTGEASPLSGLMISNAANDGDELALQLVLETADYLARGIADLAHLIDPAAFILGGAVNFGGNHSPLGQKFLERIVLSTRKIVFPVLADRLVVKFAELGSEAGFVGAAGLARTEYNKRR